VGVICGGIRVADVEAVRSILILVPLVHAPVWSACAPPRLKTIVSPA